MNPGVIFRKHHTVENGSDHDLLVVDITLVNKDGYPNALRVVECNIGNADYHDILRAFRIAGHYGVVSFLEAGGRKRKRQIKAAARVYGFKVNFGFGAPGQASTPLCTGPGVEVRANLARLLLDRVRVGKGAGPSYNKPKFWLGGRYRVGRNPFGARSTHNLASMQSDRRFALAKVLYAPVVRRSKRALFVILTIGDVNSDTDERLGEWLVDQGMTSNHHELGRIPTFKNRAIDWVLVAQNKVLTADSKRKYS